MGWLFYSSTIESNFPVLTYVYSLILLILFAPNTAPHLILVLQVSYFNIWVVIRQEVTAWNDFDGVRLHKICLLELTQMVINGCKKRLHFMLAMSFY